MQEETEFVGLKDVRYRKDVVFSQAVRFKFVFSLIVNNLTFNNVQK